MHLIEAYHLHLQGLAKQRQKKRIQSQRLQGRRLPKAADGNPQGNQQQPKYPGL